MVLLTHAATFLHCEACIETTPVETISRSKWHQHSESEPDSPVHLQVSPMTPFIPIVEGSTSRSDRLIRAVHSALVFYARCSFEDSVHISLPHPVDICIMPSILNIFLTAQPHNEVFSSIFLSLDRLIPRWIHEARAQLMKELTTSVLPEPGSTTLVAFTLLQCNCCGAVRSFPSALFHDCSNRPYHLSYKPEDDILSSDISMLKNAVLYKIGRRAWDARTFRPQPDSLIRIQNVIAAVNGGTIETATSLDFDELDPRLVCELCIRKVGENFAMPWRSAVFHCLVAHYDFSAREVTWISLRKEDIMDSENAANESLGAIISYLKYDLEPKWACAHCNPCDRPHELDLDKPQVITHLFEAHGLSDPVLARDFYRLTDSDPYIVYPCYLDSEHLQVQPSTSR